MTPAPRKTSLKTWLARLLPWVIAIVVLVALFTKYDPREVAAQMAKGHTARLFAIPFLLPLVYLAQGAIWERLVLRYTLSKGPSYVDILRGRAGTALLMLLGYFFGHGAFGIWLARKSGARARAVSGIVVYNMVGDLSGLSLIAVLAIFAGGAEVAAPIRVIVLCTFLLPILLVLVGPSFAGKVHKDDAEIFGPWKRVPRHFGVLQVFGRSLNVALIVAAAWLGARVFGMPIPLTAFATSMPLILLATALPISVAGFGAAQAAWLVFLPYAPGEQILAFQLLWQVFMGLGIVVRGLPFVSRVVREVRGKEEA